MQFLIFLIKGLFGCLQVAFAICITVSEILIIKVATTCTIIFGFGVLNSN